jgi:hypothetical protein
MRRTAESAAISISAFRQNKAGGVSPENAAQHLVPPGATWQRLPSFLIQKPQDFLHARDWLYQRQRVEADVATDGAHVADQRRRDGLCGFDENGVLLAEELRVFDLVQSSQRADLDSLLGFVNSPEFFYLTQVQDVLWLEEFLPHRRKQVSAARKDANVAGVLGEMLERVGKSARADELEF